MNHRLFQAALGGALVLAGCGTTGLPGAAPAGQASAIDTVTYDLASTGYAVASVDTAAAGSPLAVTACAASSTRSDAFRASYAIDGNLHSAWAPAATDTAPALTLSLAGATRLSRIALKQSHSNVTIDVEASVGGGNWQTVASGLAPVATQLSDLDLAACQADRVRITFHGSGLADLQVCEVELFGTPTSAAPIAPMPTPAPTASASATPERPCTVTGGGWLPVDEGDGSHRVSFAFVVDTTGPACSGTIDIHDLDAGNAYHGTVTSAVCRGNLVTFAGKLDDDEAFTATVVDESAHGIGDTLSFSSSGGTLFCGRLEDAARMGGRIRIRPKPRRAEADLDADTDEWQQLSDDGVDVEQVGGHRHARLDDFDARCPRDDDGEEGPPYGRARGHHHDD